MALDFVPYVRYSEPVPPRLVSESALLDRLTGLFRDKGFDSATMAEIAEATGLQKSSLYHRFKDGKQQMASEVAAGIGEHFSVHILAPLRTDDELHVRVRNVARNLSKFYESGRRACLLESLSVGSVGPAARAQLAIAANAWIDAFATVSQASGCPRREALERAQDAVASIEGALVLARVTGDATVFARAAKRLPAVLLHHSD